MSEGAEGIHRQGLEKNREDLGPIGHPDHFPAGLEAIVLHPKESGPQLLIHPHILCPVLALTRCKVTVYMVVETSGKPHCHPFTSLLCILHFTSFHSWVQVSWGNGLTVLPLAPTLMHPAFQGAVMTDCVSLYRTAWVSSYRDPLAEGKLQFTQLEWDVFQLLKGSFL